MTIGKSRAVHLGCRWQMRWRTIGFIYIYIFYIFLLLCLQCTVLCWWSRRRAGRKSVFKEQDFSWEGGRGFLSLFTCRFHQSPGRCTKHFCFFTGTIFLTFTILFFNEQVISTYFKRLWPLIRRNVQLISEISNFKLKSKHLLYKYVPQCNMFSSSVIFKTFFFL